MQEQVVIASQDFFDNIQVLSDFVRNFKDNNSSEDEFLTVDETAEILKMGKTKIYSLIHSQKIRHKRVGNRIRVYKKDLVTA